METKTESEIKQNEPETKKNETDSPLKRLIGMAPIDFCRMAFEDTSLSC